MYWSWCSTRRILSPPCSVPSAPQRTTFSSCRKSSLRPGRILIFNWRSAPLASRTCSPALLFSNYSCVSIHLPQLAGVNYPIFAPYESVNPRIHRRIPLVERFTQILLLVIFGKAAVFQHFLELLVPKRVQYLQVHASCHFVSAGMGN